MKLWTKALVAVGILASVSTAGTQVASASTASFPQVMLANAFMNWQQNLGVRPKMIILTTDGDGGLYNLTWANWTYSTAHGTGRQEVRCWNNPPHVPYPACPGGGGVQNSFLVPVKVTLSALVATSYGPVFSKISVKPNAEGARLQYFGGAKVIYSPPFLGTPPKLVLPVDPIQHALQVAGSRLCQEGNCRVIAPATTMPSARVDDQMEVLAGHGTTFTLTNSPSAALAHQVYESFAENGNGEAVVRMGTYVLAVNQPVEMCYWLDRAVHVAHLPLATDANGNC